MSLRELANDLSLLEAKIRNMRLIVNLPLTQNRSLTVSERENVKAILNEMLTIINKHLTELG